MCWATRHKPVGVSEPPIRHTAEEDIPVFKVMRFDIHGDLSSLYKNYKYYLNNTDTTELQHPELQTYDTVSCYTIDKGFHSYDPKTVSIREGEFVNLNFRGAKRAFICHSENDDDEPEYLDSMYILTTVRVECVIPKGSEYYLNEKGEYVSNSIRIISYKRL